MSTQATLPPATPAEAKSGGGVVLQRLVMPSGGYRVIVADPPWKYLWGDGGMKCPERHYNTLTPDELCALPVKRLRAPNCALALWATGPCLPDAMRIMEAWGFKYKTILFVWVKQNRIAKTIVTGCGSYTRSACELVLLGMRGHVKRETSEAISQVILSPRGGHSQKPEIMQDLLMRIFPGGPYLELFARRKRPGWDVFGNQVECDLLSDAQPTGHNKVVLDSHENQNAWI